MSTAPYATLLGFTRYVGRTGPGKATFVDGLRRQRESRAGFNPHGPLVKALKADIRFHTDGTHLAGTVAQVKPRWRPLYETLTTGALKYLHTLDEGTLLVPVRDTLGVIGGLTVKINPHFGLRHDDGRAELVRLHFDEEPPRDEAVTATLHLMSRHGDQILPGAQPVLVDVRRGEAIRRDRGARAADVEHWLAGEAAAFSAMWGAAA